MALASRKYPVIASVMALLVAIGGCALGKAKPVPSEEDRASLRSVAIACGRYLPESSFTVPAKGPGQGALVGGAMGFAIPLQGAAASGNPYAIIMAAAIGAVFAPIGAVIGAGNAMPLEEARASEAALRNALSDLKIQESLRDRLIVEARKNAAPRTFRIIEGGPGEPVKRAEYGITAGDGVDSILEVQVTRVGLATSTWGSDPPMGLFLDVKLRQVRVRDDADRWNRRLTYRSTLRRYSEWAEDGGRRLKDEFDRSYVDIAEKAIEEVFSVVPLR